MGCSNVGVVWAFPNSRFMKKIGIIGVGMVGGALKRWFENQGITPYLYDKYKNLGSLEEVNKADYIFICLPTPYKNGCDTSLINEGIKNIKGSKTIIIKSTIIPETTDRLQKKYPQHKILFNPEFLTEATADQDISYPDRQIVGYTDKSFTIAKDIILMLPLAPFERIVPAFIAEFVKYYTNTWFAMRVSKNNEMYDVFKKFGGTDEQFRVLAECSGADKRIGNSHLEIWHKGYRGYGGKCLPKDTKSFIKFAEKLKVKVPITKAADDYNDKLR